MDEAHLSNTWMLESVSYQLCNSFLGYYSNKSTSPSDNDHETSCMNEVNKSCATCLYHWTSLWKHLLPLVPSHMIDERLRHWIVLVKLLASSTASSSSSDGKVTNNTRAFELLVDAIESQTINLRVDEASASGVTKYLHTKIAAEYFDHEDVKSARSYMQKYPSVSQGDVAILQNDEGAFLDALDILRKPICGYVHSVMVKLGQPAIYCLIGRTASHMATGESKVLSKSVEGFVTNNFDGNTGGRDGNPEECMSAETITSVENMPGQASPVYDRISTPSQTASVASDVGCDYPEVYNSHGCRVPSGCTVDQNQSSRVGMTFNTEADSADDEDETQVDILPECTYDDQAQQFNDFSSNIRTSNTISNKLSELNIKINKIDCNTINNSTDNSNFRNSKFVHSPKTKHTKTMSEVFQNNFIGRLPEVKVCLRRLNAPDLNGATKYSPKQCSKSRSNLPLEEDDENDHDKENEIATDTHGSVGNEEQESIVSSTTEVLDVHSTTEPSHCNNYKNYSPNNKNYGSKYGPKRRSGGKPLFSDTSPVYRRIHDEQRLSAQMSTSEPKRLSPSKFPFQRHSSPVKVADRHREDSGESVTWTSDEEEDMLLLQLTERKRKQPTKGTSGDDGGNVSDGQRPRYVSTLGQKRVKRKGGRMKFTAEEEQYVIDGVRRYGSGNWAMILNTYDFHQCRDNVSIKDKYRNLVKQGRITEK